MRYRRGVSGLLVLLAVLALTGQRCSSPGSGNNTPPANDEPQLPPTGSGNVDLGVQLVVRGLERPTFLTAPPGDPRLFIVEQTGRILVIKDGVRLARPFLNVSDRVTCCNERGLLGLAFAPDYATSGLFYVNYYDVDANTRVVRYRVSADPDVADPASAEVLLTIPQPRINHNGGMLAFGFDGHLYIGMGDGGGAGDPDELAQNDATLLGKMLRIDVSGGLGSGYSIPPSNPYANGTLPLPEIWAKGLRNPYRFSFDRVMGDLYIADVGQATIEEINVEPFDAAGGRNYGWDRMEGTQCYEPVSNCNDGSLTLPVYEYTHDGGRCSVTGGYVYRGSIAAIFGHYFFADFCSDQVFSFVWDGDGGVTDLVERSTDLQEEAPLQRISSFGEDGFGELYIVQFGPGNVGEVYRIVEMTATGARQARSRR